MKTRYTLKQFNDDFKTDADALDFIFKMKYPNGATCKCGKKDCFYPIKKRKCYCCSHCGYQLSPTAGTIFHKSETSLKSWLFAMFLISNSKNGVSAMELMRQVGVTYKTAWRMNHQIRKLMKQDDGKLSGQVEADETYIGGLAKNMHKAKRQGIRTGGTDKTPIIGVMQRGGAVKAVFAKNIKNDTLVSNIARKVEKGSFVYTDEHRAYNGLHRMGYLHNTVQHMHGKFTHGQAHTNTIEGFWSQLKRSINGTFHHVSDQHLQKYVDEFVYRYNHRRSVEPVFSVLSARVAEQHA
jgi:transposase